MKSSQIELYIKASRAAGRAQFPEVKYCYPYRSCSYSVFFIIINHGKQVRPLQPQRLAHAPRVLGHGVVQARQHVRRGRAAPRHPRRPRRAHHRRGEWHWACGRDRVRKVSLISVSIFEAIARSQPQRHRSCAAGVAYPWPPHLVLGLFLLCSVGALTRR
jgi:hypothetical protein